jgi:NhaP-type Na+/H+ or K+/H+ antiporter
VTTDDILLGIGLVLVLAVSCQLLAPRLRIPAIVLLLPAGFVAGIATDDVNPDNLLGDLYQPLVSIAVGVILFEAGLGLVFGRGGVGGHGPVLRLVTVGGAVTWAGVAAAVALLFGDLSSGLALLIGAILVVSGPTVVLPLLAFIRPAPRIRSVLRWEGVLIDPIGALLGVFVFHAVSAGAGVAAAWRPGQFVLALCIGGLIGAGAAAVLWLLLRAFEEEPQLAALATLMVVVAAVVGADLLREDSGFVAATVMGIAFANQRFLSPARRTDLSSTLQFHQTLVPLLIGVLFVLISASVSPDDVADVLPEALGLVAVMVLLVRPVSVLLSTWRSRLTWRERAFAGWMAPRGIVAGATASAFGLQLAQDDVAGADEVLPIVFVVIFTTVVVYGLTAPVVARALGVAGARGGTVLVVGGHAWARELALALSRSGVAVRMWVGPAAEQEAARALGLDADRGRMMVDAVSREADLEGITDALLLTRSDDFNALAAEALRAELGRGHVYRVAPDPDAPDLLPPSTEQGILGGPELTSAELGRRFEAGARFVVRETDVLAGAGDIALFRVTADRVIALVPPGADAAVDTAARETAEP